jgi:hypothetical protein
MKIAELLQEAPKGPDWKVQFQVRSNVADSWDSGQFTVHDYVGKEKAKAAAVDYLLKKYKGREAKVTRITQVPWKKA